MAFLRKLVEVLYRYYDKMILGVLLVLLAVVMYFQAANMEATRKRVEGIREETLRILEQKPDLPVADVAKYTLDLEPDLRREWLAAYSFPPIPAEARLPHKPRLRRYLYTTGSGTMFDPVCYVYAMDPSSPVLLDFTTGRNPFTGTLDTPTKPAAEEVKTDGPGAGGTTPPPEPPTEVDPLALLRLRSFRQPSLGIVLMTINRPNPDDKATWRVQLNLTGGTRPTAVFGKVGEPIANSGWVITDAKVEREELQGRGVSTEVHYVQIERDDDSRWLRGREDLGVGDPEFSLVYLAPDGKPQQFATQRGKTFKLADAEGKETTYEVLDGEEDMAKVRADRFVRVQPVGPDGKATRPPTRVGLLSQRDLSEYREKHRTKIPGSEYGPEGMPMPMDPGMVPIMPPTGGPPQNLPRP